MRLIPRHSIVLDWSGLHASSMPVSIAAYKGAAWHVFLEQPPFVSLRKCQLC